ncbi:MAG: rhodanese-like domain-containing protein [Saprospiraceae bacterium]|nr:rhodanese-like domain-containing protein [Saprospiraceae bacterium]
MTIRILQVSVLVLFLLGCKDVPYNSYSSDITTGVNVEEAKKLIKERSDLIIVDVRTPQEWEAGSLPGTINIDVKANDFESQIKKLDSSDTYLVHCRSGARSTKAVKVMEEQGFKNIYHLDGGFLAWTKK